MHTASVHPKTKTFAAMHPLMGLNEVKSLNQTNIESRMLNIFKRFTPHNALVQYTEFDVGLKQMCAGALLLFTRINKRIVRKIV